ncbi:helix-turn-helix domain-containing protein [Pseudomarimonas salicorniae]|uniref:Helix-turn-helix transcriptional regulator n=1 Tax=Pseudomarimonas salicorniae TaxID=2933270 RepID=A0ABT0GLB4_9GAMM|nr:helix-turn-helix transcriptional regulator [Lysobacter sp. CAU 1642]MCK7595327.1 helix-turn-helix transcriptional regulator [Lysobacter sp. CAU 1642]
MRQTTAIHLALKKLLKAHGKTYAEAAVVLELSEASVKRLFARAELSLERLERLCDWIHVDLADLVEQAQAVQPLVTQLTPEQERELLKDPALLLTTFLVLNRWKESEILAVYAFSKPQLTLMLIRLEKIGLIELMPFDRIKLRTARNFAWRKDGPIQRYFAERVLPEFLGTRFADPGERMHFVGGMLSRASVHKLHEAMEALARQLDALVEADLGLPVEERHGVSLLAALRPWEFTEFTKLRRGPRQKYF